MKMQEAARPRVLLASIRELNRGAAWCSNYEFEDVICRVDDVARLVLQPGRLFAPRQRLVRGLNWRRLPASQRMNPGVVPVRLTRDYDLFVFVCMNVWDLFYLNALEDWRDCARTKICFMVEFWAGWADQPEYAHLFAAARGFDHVIQSFSGSVAATARLTGKPTHHIPLAADVLRFTPYPVPPERSIDVFSMGRRAEPVHTALRALAAETGLFYMHDTIPGSLVQPAVPAEHRDVLAACAKRSRCFVTYPAKFGDQGEHQGQSEVGARYYEGAAAGAVLLGQAPSVPAFMADFPWSDAVVELSADGSNVARALAELRDAPERAEALGRRSAIEALRRHDWGHRWQALLQIAGLEPRPALVERLGRLSDLAAAATAAATGGRHPELHSLRT